MRIRAFTLIFSMFFSLNCYAMQNNNQLTTTYYQAFSIQEQKYTFLTHESFHCLRWPYVKFNSIFMRPETTKKGKQLLKKLLFDDSLPVHEDARILAGKDLLDWYSNQTFASKKNNNSVHRLADVAKRMESFSSPLSSYYLGHYYENIERKEKALENYRKSYKFALFDEHDQITTGIDWTIVYKLLALDMKKNSDLLDDIFRHTPIEEIKLLKLNEYSQYTETKELMLKKDPQLKGIFAALEQKNITCSQKKSQIAAIEERLHNNERLKNSDISLLIENYVQNKEYQKVYELSVNLLQNKESESMGRRGLRRLIDVDEQTAPINFKAAQRLFMHELQAKKIRHSGLLWYLYMHMGNERNKFLINKKLISPFVELLHQAGDNKNLLLLGSDLIKEKKSYQQGIEVIESIRSEIPAAFWILTHEYLKNNNFALASQNLAQALEKKSKSGSKKKEIISQSLLLAEKAAFLDKNVAHELWKLYQVGWGPVSIDREKGKKYHDLAFNLGHPHHLLLHVEQAVTEQEYKELQNLINQTSGKKEEWFRRLAKYSPSSEEYKKLLRFYLFITASDEKKALAYFEKARFMEGECLKDVREEALSRIVKMSKTSVNAAKTFLNSYASYLSKYAQECPEGINIDLGYAIGQEFIRRAGNSDELKPILNTIGLAFKKIALYKKEIDQLDEAIKLFKFAYENYNCEQAKVHYQSLTLKEQNTVEKKTKAALEIIESMIQSDLPGVECIEIINNLLTQPIGQTRISINIELFENKLVELFRTHQPLALQFFLDYGIYEKHKEFAEKLITEHPPTTNFEKILAACVREDWAGVGQLFLHSDCVEAYPYVIACQNLDQDKLLQLSTQFYHYVSFNKSKFQKVVEKSVLLRQLDNLSKNRDNPDILLLLLKHYLMPISTANRSSDLALCGLLLDILHEDKKEAKSVVFKLYPEIKKNLVDNAKTNQGFFCTLGLITEAYAQTRVDAEKIPLLKEALNYSMNEYIYFAKNMGDDVERKENILNHVLRIYEMLYTALPVDEALELIHQLGKHVLANNPRNRKPLELLGFLSKNKRYSDKINEIIEDFAIFDQLYSTRIGWYHLDDGNNRLVIKFPNQQNEYRYAAKRNTQRGLDLLIQSLFNGQDQSAQLLLRKYFLKQINESIAAKKNMHLELYKKYINKYEKHKEIENSLDHVIFHMLKNDYKTAREMRMKNQICESSIDLITGYLIDAELDEKQEIETVFPSLFKIFTSEKIVDDKHNITFCNEQIFALCKKLKTFFNEHPNPLFLFFEQELEYYAELCKGNGLDKIQKINEFYQLGGHGCYRLVLDQDSNKVEKKFVNNEEIDPLALIALVEHLFVEHITFVHESLMTPEKLAQMAKSYLDLAKIGLAFPSPHNAEDIVSIMKPEAIPFIPVYLHRCKEHIAKVVNRERLSNEEAQIIISKCDELIEDANKLLASRVKKQN